MAWHFTMPGCTWVWGKIWAWGNLEKNVFHFCFQNCPFAQPEISTDRGRPLTPNHLWPNDQGWAFSIANRDTMFMVRILYPLVYKTLSLALGSKVQSWSNLTFSFFSDKTPEVSEDKLGYPFIFSFLIKKLMHWSVHRASATVKAVN